MTVPTKPHMRETWDEFVARHGGYPEVSDATFARFKAICEAPLPPLPSALPSQRENNAVVAS